MSKIVTGNLEISYVNFPDGEDALHSVCLTIPEGKQLQEIRQAITEAIQEGIASKWEGRRPEQLRSPLRQDADGAYFLNASSTQRPGVVDESMLPLDPETLRSGRRGNVSITFFPYRIGSSCGIGAGLNNIQLLSF